MMATITASRAQYLCLSASLRKLPGRKFETHSHPAVVLDHATGPATRVWGWWTTGRPALPCLLWSGELGWSATVVEPDVFDTEGYERAFWCHRIKLLDLALANALGPCPTLEQLELQVAAEASFGAGSRASELTESMLWGILQLRAARAGGHGSVPARAPVLGPGTGMRAAVDDELVRRGLSPAFAKTKARIRHPKPRDGGLAALVQALSKSTGEARRHVWGLHH
jgi:hypothetical protein